MLLSLAPHMHFRVAHRDFKPLFTEIYFDGERRNASDATLRAIPRSHRELLMSDVTRPPNAVDGEALNAYVEITLVGRNRWRHY